MAKIDWDWHRENYRKQKLESGLTYKEYADHYGFNVNTARRELSKKTGEEPQITPEAKRDHEADMIIKKKGRKAPHSKALTELSGQEARGETRPKEQKKKNNSKDARAKMINDVREGEVIPHEKKPRGKGKPFEPGNEVNLVPNRRGVPRQADIDAAMPILEAGLEACEMSTLESTVAHMQLLRRTTGRAVELFESEIAALDTPGSQKDDDEQPSGPHPLLKLTKLLIEVGYLMNDHTSRISAIRTGKEKLQLDFEKQARKASEAQVIAEAYALRDKEEWDIVTTAEYIERHGVKLPDSIALRLAKEIKDYEPPANDAGEVDEEQLDREARRYREAQANRDAFVQERRAMVAQLVDESGYGDTTAQGVRREGEFDADDESIDIDYEATQDIYGSAPEIAIEPPGDDE